MVSLLSSITDVFSENGVLSQAIDNFHPRTEQIRLAQAIDETISEKSILVAEAGTGTGKTFAYLVPVILAGKKTIISTGTKSLQDQLFHRDLPRLIEALAMPVKTALLKGRSNYLCLYRLENADPNVGLFSRNSLKHFQDIRKQLPRMIQGDVAELTDIPADSGVWPSVTSTADNCLGTDCEFYQKCFVVKARRQALAADLIVVNHHLFFADVKIREDGFGEILPGAEVVVFDEAHQLPEVATNFFGMSLSSRQLNDLSRDIQTEAVALANDMMELVDAADDLTANLVTCRNALGPSNGRYPWNQTQQRTDLPQALEAIRKSLTDLQELLKSVQERSPGLQTCLKRCIDAAARFNLLTNTQHNHIQWFENYSKSFVFHLTPLSIATEFKQLMQEKKAWIFTSATLAVGDDFSHFLKQCGLDNAKTLQCHSPFDYENQALMYFPRGLPDPKDPKYVDRLFEAALPVIQAAKGGVFFLFTSFNMLTEIANRLADKTELPLFIQGQASSGELLAQFRAHGNGILLGTYSFWEGVDVKGEALRCVIIDRLPFENPSDPILKAKLDLIAQQGHDPFSSHQIPLAVITLKQGSGRLLRDEKDRGVLVICDPRLCGRSYGQTFLSSLPRFSRTRDIRKVQMFFDEPETT